MLEYLSTSLKKNEKFFDLLVLIIALNLYFLFKKLQSLELPINEFTLVRLIKLDNCSIEYCVFAGTIVALIYDNAKILKI